MSASASLTACDIGGALSSSTSSSPLGPTMEASACARMKPGLASRPPQLPEWWPPSRRSTSRSKLHGAAAAEAERRPVLADARAVRGDEDVGGEVGLVLPHQLLEALRARLLAHLDHELGVEAEPAAALGHDGPQRGHVDGVLALVVGGAAAVEAVAVARRHPRTLALGPLVLQAAHDIAVAVAEHRRQRRILDARGEQHRALALDRVVVDLAT